MIEYAVQHWQMMVWQFIVALSVCIIVILARP